MMMSRLNCLISSSRRRWSLARGLGPIQTGWRGWEMDLHRDAVDCLTWAARGTPVG